MSGIRDLRKVQGGSEDLSRFQDKLEEFVKPIINCAILDGRHITNIELSAGENTVEHKLSRPLRGWWVTGKSAQADIWDDQANNNLKSKTLILNSDSDVTISLWCF